LCDAIATASAEETGSSREIEVTTSAYVPITDAVTSAYASVREMIRSMANSRYRRIATPMDAGTSV